MKKLFSTLTLIAATLIGSSVAHAANSAPLEWQRVQLEDRLQERLSKAVGNSLPGEQFFVTVTVDLLPVKAKDKAPEKVVTPEAAQKKPLVPQDDILPLGKLDLEAPYVAPENIIQPAQAAMEPPVLENAPNIFDSIRQINAAVYIDNSISETKKEFIRQITVRILGNVGQSAPVVTVEKADLDPKKPVVETPPPPKAPEIIIEPWTLPRIATEFKIPISLVLISIIGCIFLGTFGTLVFRGYRALESRRLGILEAKEAREQEAPAPANSYRGNVPAANGTVVQTSREEVRSSDKGSSAISGKFNEADQRYSGVSQLKDILKSSPEHAALVVRQIIKDSSPISRDTLNYLSRYLRVEEFHALAKTLTSQERQEWKKQVGKESTSIDEGKISAYLAAQVAEDVLGGLSMPGDDFKELISEVTLPTALDVATESVELGAVLMNVIPSGLAARLFTLLPIDRANEITVASVSLSADKIRSMLPRLRQALQSIRTGKADIPFISRALELLRSASPQKEAAIFGALAQSDDPMVLETAAREHFPSELISQLPSSFLKDFLNDFPSPKRAEIIASRPEQERQLLLDALGGSGSKSREMMELDIQQMLSTELSAQRLERNREALWKGVSEQFRALLKRDENVAELAENVLSDWLNIKLNRAPVRIGGQRAA